MKTTHHARTLTSTDLGLYVRVTSSLDHTTVAGILRSFTARADILDAGTPGRPHLVPGERRIELTIGTRTEIHVHPDDRVEAWNPADLTEQT